MNKSFPEIRERLMMEMLEKKVVTCNTQSSIKTSSTFYAIMNAFMVMVPALVKTKEIRENGRRTYHEYRLTWPDGEQYAGYVLRIRKCLGCSE
jgi:hypothetical protein